jgi:hypothetical protein
MALSGNSLVITGQSFFTVGYTVTGSYMNAPATSITVDSETQVTMTFEGGVPITTKTEQERDERANVWFKLDGTETIFKSINTGDDIKDFVNPFTFESGSKGLSCSFNGGCNL